MTTQRSTVVGQEAKPSCHHNTTVVASSQKLSHPVTSLGASKIAPHNITRDFAVTESDFKHGKQVLCKFSSKVCNECVSLKKLVHFGRRRDATKKACRVFFKMVSTSSGHSADQMMESAAMYYSNMTNQERGFANVAFKEHRKRISPTAQAKWNWTGYDDTFATHKVCMATAAFKRMKIEQGDEEMEAQGLAFEHHDSSEGCDDVFTICKYCVNAHRINIIMKKSKHHSNALCGFIVDILKSESTDFCKALLADVYSWPLIKDWFLIAVRRYRDQIPSQLHCIIWPPTDLVAQGLNEMLASNINKTLEGMGPIKVDFPPIQIEMPALDRIINGFSAAMARTEDAIERRILGLSMLFLELCSESALSSKLRSATIFMTSFDCTGHLFSLIGNQLASTLVQAFEGLCNQVRNAKDYIAQAGGASFDESLFVGTIKLLAAMIPGIGTFDVVEQQERVRKLEMISKAVNSWDKLYKFVEKLVRYAYDAICEHLYGTKYVERELMAHEKDIHEWAVRVIEYYNNGGLLKVTENSADAETVVGWKKEADMYMARLLKSGKNRSATFMMSFRVVYTMVEKMFTASAHFHVAHHLRIVPMMAYIFGEPGVGKSLVLNIALTQMMNRIDTIEGRSDRFSLERNVYVRNEIEKFWSGYRPVTHRVTVYDDGFQVRDGTTMQELAMQIVRCVNITAFPLPMPDVDSKGQVDMRSRVIMLTANIPPPYAELSKVVHSAEAVLRRFNLVVEQTVKPEFQNELGHIDVRKLRVKFPAKESLVDGKVVKVWDHGSFNQVYDFHLCDYVGQRVRKMTYDQYIDLLVKTYFDVRDQEQITLNTIAQVEEMESKFVAQGLRQSVIAQLPVATSEDEEDFQDPDGVTDDMIENALGSAYVRELIGAGMSREELEILYRKYVLYALPPGPESGIRRLYRLRNQAVATLQDLTEGSVQFLKDLAEKPFVKFGLALLGMIATAFGAYKLYQMYTSPGTKTNEVIETEGQIHEIVVRGDHALSREYRTHIDDCGHLNCKHWAHDIYWTEETNKVFKDVKKRGSDAVAKHLEHNANCPGDDKCTYWGHVSRFGFTNIWHRDRKQAEAAYPGDKTNQNRRVILSQEAAYPSDRTTQNHRVIQSQSTNLYPTVANGKFTDSNGEYDIVGKFANPADFPMINAESSSDENAIALATSKLVHACVRLYCTFDDGPSVQSTMMRGMHIGGRLLIAPAHMIYGWQTHESGTLRIVDSHDSARMFTLAELEFDMTWAQERDIVVIVLPKSVPPSVNLTRSFHDENALSKNGLTEAYMYVTHEDRRALMKQTFEIKRVEGEVAYSMTNHVGMKIGSVSIVNRFEYKLGTQRGECGSPVVWMNSKVQSGRILGFHTAGATNKGVANVLTSQFIRSVHAKHRTVVVEQPETDPTMQPQYVAQRAVDESTKKVAYIGRIGMSNYNRQATNTRIKPSALFGVFPVQTKPAYLQPFVRDGVRIFPSRLAIAKMGADPTVFPEHMVKLAAAHLSHTIGNLQSSYAPRVLTLWEAVNGTGEEFIAKMDMHTSSGFPYTMLRKSNDPKGKFLFVKTSNGVTYEVDETVRYAVNQRIALAKEGVIPFTLFADQLKDERRPIEKADAGKTRLFNVAPFDFNLALRMYTSAFMAHVMDNHTLGEISVGINVHGDEWGMMYTQMLNNGKNWIGGDYGNYDKTLSYQLLMECCTIINTWYDDGPENALIRETLFSTCFSAYHVTGVDVYRVKQGNPSGIALTAIINSMVNALMFRIVYIANGGDITNYLSKVCVKFYGDDNIGTVSDDVAHILNMEILEKTFVSYGIEYTTPSKKAISSKFLADEDITYLKRGFRLDGGRVYAPLAMVSIQEMIMWIRESFDDQEAMEANWIAATCEMFHHGRQAYEKFVEHVCAFSKVNKIRLPFVTFMLSGRHWGSEDDTGVILPNSETSYAEGYCCQLETNEEIFEISQKRTPRKIKVRKLKLRGSLKPQCEQNNG